MHQRQASARTAASDRDTFWLLLRFVHARTDKAPSNLSLRDLDAPLLAAFLDHIEQGRGNGARTRNTRLAAIHALLRYAALYDPVVSALVQRVLATPRKRFEQQDIAFLTHGEIKALVAAADTTTWLGRRDRTLLLGAAYTRLRVSELIALSCRDVVLGQGAHVHCLRKARKAHCTPLRGDALTALRARTHERGGRSEDPLFPNRHKGPLSHDSIALLVGKYAVLARRHCPSLAQTHITPHVLHHRATMALRQNGVDRVVIALWLGHESVETMQIYLHADVRIKEQALAKNSSACIPPGRYRPDDGFLGFLESLKLCRITPTAKPELHRRSTRDSA